MSGRIKEILLRKGTAASAALFLAFLAVWEWGPGLAGIPTYFIPPLSDVWTEFLRMLDADRLMFHTAITTAEVISGFILGSLLGVSVGYALGMSPSAEFVLLPQPFVEG